MPISGCSSGSVPEVGLHGGVSRWFELCMSHSLSDISGLCGQAVCSFGCEHILGVVWEVGECLQNSSSALMVRQWWLQCSKAKSHIKIWEQREELAFSMKSLILALFSFGH